jgi:hypothetical protein
MQLCFMYLLKPKTITTEGRKMKEKKSTNDHVIMINNAAARTKGNYFDVDKERYYYIYPAPPKPKKDNSLGVITNFKSLISSIW